MKRKIEAETEAANELPMDAIFKVTENQMDSEEPGYFQRLKNIKFDLNELPRGCFLHQVLLICSDSFAEKHINRMCETEGKLRIFEMPPGEFELCRLIILDAEFERWLQFGAQLNKSGLVEKWREYCKHSQRTRLSKKDLKEFTDDEIGSLIKLGFLLIHQGGFLVTLPHLARLISQMNLARKHIVTMLKKRPSKEMPLELLASRYQTSKISSVLSVKYVLWDMEGCGLIQRTKVPNGSLIKLLQYICRSIFTPGNSSASAKVTARLNFADFKVL